MLEGPSDEAREVVGRGLVSCADDDALATSGKMYYDHFMYACKVLLLSNCCFSSAILKAIQQLKRLVKTAHPHLPRRTSGGGPLSTPARR